MRFVAPAGAPVRVRDLIRWGGLAASVPDVCAALKALVRDRFGIRHVFLSSTGRAGLTLVFRAMRRLAPDRDEVILPSYTCYSVAASAVKAGLRIRIVDISPETLDYTPTDLASADFSRVLALVATSLYGLPANLPALEKLARDRGVFLVDDAAQAMGATVGGRPSGTWGDAGLFSFDKGKNIAAIDGGVMVTQSDELGAALEAEVASVVSSPPVSTTIAHLLKAVGYCVLLRPSVYGLVARAPALGLGQTIFTTAFPIMGPDSALVALALTMMQRLEEFSEARRANAAALLNGLHAITAVHPIRPTTNSRPVYLRLPVLCATRAARDASIAALNRAGIGATGSYPASLLDVPEVASALAAPASSGSGGRRVAGCILTLPTHTFVTERDISRMLGILEASTECIGRRGPAFRFVAP